MASRNSGFNSTTNSGDFEKKSASLDFISENFDENTQNLLKLLDRIEGFTAQIRQTVLDEMRPKSNIVSLDEKESASQES